MTAADFSALEHFVDLDRYPIHDLDSVAGQALLDRAHEMMRRDTLVVFDGFLKSTAVDVLAGELDALEPGGHRIDYPSTPYGWLDNRGFPPEHPRSALPRRNCGVLTTDLIPGEGPTRALFACDELTEFVRRMLGYQTLYRSECPILSIQVNTMREDDRFGWHFDTNDGVVSFTIQNADTGGGFEYEPLIRDEDDENYDGVGRILSGDHTPRQPDMHPGTLSLFLGRRSIHRVAPVGPTQKARLSLLFSYDQQPGMVFPPTSCARMQGGSNEPYFGIADAPGRVSTDDAPGPA